MKLIRKCFSEEIVEKRIDGINEKTSEQILNIPPYRVEIQPTTFCNRMCSFCSHTIRNKTGNEITEEKVLSILDQLINMSCNHVSFSGGGEPFEWRKGNICKVVQYAAKKMDVTITTNGDGFWDDNYNIPRNLQLAKYCSNIIINTPEIDNNRFVNITKGKCSWNKTENVLKALLEYIKGGKCVCNICCVVVVSKLNYRYLEEIDSKLQDIGVNRIYYKMIKAFEDNNLDELSVPMEELVNIRESLTDNISIWLQTFFKNIDIIGKYYSGRCWSNIMGMSAIIDPNGNVYICTPTVGIEKYILGKIDSMKFSELWKSMKRFELINLLNDCHYKKMCPKECRLNSHNIIIEDYLFGPNDKEEVTVNAGIEDIIKE